MSTKRKFTGEVFIGGRSVGFSSEVTVTAEPAPEGLVLDCRGQAFTARVSEWVWDAGLLAELTGITMEGGDGINEA